MGELLYDWVAWMSELPPGWVCAVILVVAYGENVIPPIPGDMIVVFGGYLAGLGRLDIWPVVLLSTIGGAAGFMTMYAIGRRVGVAVLDPKRFKWVPKRRVRAAQRYLDRWGYRLVAANRFLSGLRSVISLSVGMAQKPAWATTFWATASAFVWTLLLTLAGYFVGENWEVVGEYLRNYGLVIAALIVVAVVVQYIRYRALRRTEGGNDGQGT